MYCRHWESLRRTKRRSVGTGMRVWRDIHPLFECEYIDDAIVHGYNNNNTMRNHRGEEEGVKPRCRS